MPWIPTLGALSPIQRVPRVSGPGPNRLLPSAQAELGGVQVGCRTFEMILYEPVGVGYAGCPTATEYVFTSLPSE